VERLVQWRPRAVGVTLGDEVASTSMAVVRRFATATDAHILLTRIALARSAAGSG